MKKISFMLLAAGVITSFFIGSGCSATVSTMTASGMSKLKAEPMEVWTRPIEFGFTVIGIGEGTAENELVKDSLSSKKVVDSTPSFFLGGSIDDRLMSPIVKLAAFNAIQKANADGMYLTMVKEEADGSVKKAWVKGLLLKLGVYGPVTADRADAKRTGSCKSHKEIVKLNSEPAVMSPAVESIPETTN